MPTEQYRYIISGDNTQYVRTLLESKQKTEEASGSIVRSVNTIGAALAGVFSVSKAKEAIATFSGFDDTVRKIGAVTGASADEIERLGDLAQKMGRETRYTAQQSADAMVVLGQQGLKVNEIFKATPQIMALAAAEGIQIADAAEIAGTATTAFGHSVKDLARDSEILLKTSQSSNATLSSLSEAIKYVGPIVSGVGGNILDTADALGTLHNAGIKATMAGTTLRGVIDTLFNPTADEAKMMEELSSRIGGAGLQITDASGKFVGFVSLVKQLEDAGLTGAEALRLFGQRGGPGMAVLLDRGSESMAALKATIEDSSGVVTKTADALESGLGGASRRAASALEGALLKSVKELEPALIGMVSLFENAGRAADYMVGTVKTAASAASAVTGIAAGVGSVFEDITDYVGITDDSFNSMRQNATAALGSAKDLAGQASLSFSGLAGAVEEGNASLKNASQSTSDRLAEIAEATGLALSSFEDLEKAEKAGLVSFDEASQAWINTETGKGAAVEKTTEKLMRQKAEAEEASKSITALAAASEQIKKETGYTTSFSMTADVADLEKMAEKWKAASVPIEEINAAMYKKINDLMKAALNEGNEETARQLGAMADKYRDFSKQSESELKAQQEAVQKIFESTGMLGEEYYDNMVSAINQQAGELERLTGDSVAAQEWAANAVEEAWSKVSGVDAVVDVGADTSAADGGLDAISAKQQELDGQEATIKVDADISGAEAGLASVGKAVESVGMSTYDMMKNLASSSVMLNPGQVRDNMRAMEMAASDYADQIREEVSSKDRKSVADLAANELKTHNDLVQAKLRGTSSEISQAEGMYREALSARADAAREEAEAETQARKDAISSQRDAMNDQLSAAKEELSNAKQAQKEYYSQAISQARDYYNSLKEQQAAATERYKKDAEERYNADLEYYQKKLDAFQKSIDKESEMRSLLKQIYTESGAGGSEYYQSAAQGKADEAQKMKDKGVDVILVEKWLTDELKDLREKAAAEGVAGIEQYTDKVLQSYKSTGEFSSAVVSTNATLAEYQGRIDKIKEGGTDAYFDKAGLAALGFDQKIADAQDSIASLQAAADALDGKGFDIAGSSAKGLAAMVASAEARVNSLTSSVKALNEEEKRLDSQKTTSYNTTAKSSGSMGGFFGILQNALSFEGGGFTGSGPRIGGVDGKGGMLATVHPDELVVDLKSGSVKSGGQENNQTTYITVEKMEVKADSQSSLDTIVAELKRRAGRNFVKTI